MQLAQALAQVLEVEPVEAKTRRLTWSQDAAAVTSPRSDPSRILSRTRSPGSTFASRLPPRRSC
jgi:hypothetical protein